MTTAAPPSPRRRQLLSGLAACGVLGPAAWPRARAAETASVPGASEAEQLLFLQRHLANISPPSTLRYRQLRQGPAEPSGRDSVLTLTFTQGTAGNCCDVHGEDLSGTQAIRLPDIADASANPVVLYFLEQQMRRLETRTRGVAAHFRRRTRQALADTASVTAGSIRWGDADVASRIVRVSPYLDDPFRERFAQDALTEYHFVLSEAVPGMIYQMRAVAAPGREDSLTLEPAKLSPKT
jgi:hypothetical protein